MNRRAFAATLAATALGLRTPATAENAGRKLDFQIGDGFADSSPDDIRAVVNSAAESIWQHCPETRWEVPGFFIFHAEGSPITLFDHRKDGRIAIGLATQGRLWSQFAYQFAHEFCHALAGHSGDWRTTWLRGKKSNHWLEESLCEAASLFALRSMARSWETAAPYPNWRSYAKALADYATERIANTKRPPRFIEWLRENEPAMRANATIREMNNIVAVELLPLFEAAPAGWEALTFLNRTAARDPENTLPRHFAGWRAAAPEKHRAFIARIATACGAS